MDELEENALNDFDTKAVQAAKDTQLMESFVRKNEFYILKCASSAVHRYVTKNDDEWSIALSAFAQAVREYSIDKGHFMSFAQLVIKRKLIDYIRAQSKYNAEISVNPSHFECNPDDNEEDVAIKIAVTKAIGQQPDNSLTLEIEAANQAFSAYGFSFFDLTACSPKAEKTKKSCAKAVACIICDPFLVSDMKKSKLLSIKIIQKNTDIPRKILERHRKYIIAAVEIMTGDYPFLADYMQYIREELDK